MSTAARTGPAAPRGPDPASERRGIPLEGVLCRGRYVELGWPEEHEFDTLTALRNRPHVRARFLDPRPLDLERNRDWLRHGMRRPEEGLLAIRVGPGRVVCGMIGWTHWNRTVASIEIGRLVVDAALARRHLPADRRRYSGIGVDASTTLRDYAFRVMDVATMRSVYIGDNAPSARVHRLAGGHVVGSERVARQDGSVVVVTRLELTREGWLVLEGDRTHA